jgi:ketosteroid isomerase-like protein
MPNLEQQQIETIVLDWVNAVSAGDRDGILARHAPDVLMFVFPNTVREIEAYDRTWDFFFDKPEGPITYAPTNQGRIGRGLRHLRGSLRWHVGWITRFRLTVGLERQDGQWVITHEHHSMPTTAERFIEQ